MAKNSDLRRKGACNQGKEAFREKSMQSGQLRPSVTTGEARQTESLHKCASRTFSGMHAYTFLKKQTKKAHVIGFLVPFYVKHSKGFLSA